jgi:hypothetical protein
VAAQNRVNCDAIVTWQGEVEVVQRCAETIAGQPCDLTTRTKVTFAYDRVAGKYMFLATQVEKKGTKQGQTVNDSGRVVSGGIRTPDGFYEVPEWYADARKGQLRRAELFLGPRSTESPGDFSPHFDPFWYLKLYKADVHDRLMFFLENAGLKAMSDNRVSRDRNLVTVVLGEPPGATNRYVFDLDQGANVVALGGADPEVKEEHSRSFEQVQGIWVPKTTTSKNTNLRTGMVHERKVTWLRNVLNEPLPAEAFSPEQVSVRQGDFVHDRRSGVDYRYDKSGPGDLGWRIKYRSALVVAALGLGSTCILLAGWLIRRRRRKGLKHDSAAA